MPPLTSTELAGDARATIESHPFWYHTIDVAPGVTTPGLFDLRPALDRIPLPDVRGKRCLDIGTYDGFFAFELERRGAAEVVATDIEDHALWDWPADARPGVPGADAARHLAMQGPPKGAGFRLLAELMGSEAKWRPISIYDLDPADLGTFDVVVCGSLLLHLRDPVRALEAARAVTKPDGVFVSSERVELWTTLLARGRPLFKLRGSGQYCMWWIPNSAGHRRMLYAAGFEITHASRFFSVRFGKPLRERLFARNLPRRAALRVMTGTWADGVLHRALVARSRL